MPASSMAVMSSNPLRLLRRVLRRWVKACRTSRRKTLRNNLKGLLDITAIEDAGIDPGLRPERLSLADFAHLANLIKD